MLKEEERFAVASRLRAVGSSWSIKKAVSICWVCGQINGTDNDREGNRKLDG